MEKNFNGDTAEICPYLNIIKIFCLATGSSKSNILVYTLESLHKYVYKSLHQVQILVNYCNNITARTKQKIIIKVKKRF